MSSVLELSSPRLASLDSAERPCPQLRALKGCMRHEGPPLTPGEIGKRAYPLTLH